MQDVKTDKIYHSNVNHSLDSVDIAKFVGSILIFAMHCTALVDYKITQNLLEIISHWGVPFFFVSSSYFLHKKYAGGNIERKHLLHYLSRIGMLYLYWMIFNLPSIYIIHFYQKDLSSVNTWLDFFKCFFLSSTFTGSWYLVSCIFSACFIYWLSKRLKTKMILLLTLPFYLLCVFTSVYKGILPVQLYNIFYELCFPLNIFNGCFCFALGKYISENEYMLTKYLAKKRALFLFVLSYLLFVIEILFTMHFNVFGSTSVAFSTALLSYALFLICLETKISIKNNILLRKLSIIIYCCQSNVLIFNSFCKKILGGHSFIAFILSCIVVAIISQIIIIVQKKSQRKWVNYLT